MIFSRPAPPSNNNPVHPKVQITFYLNFSLYFSTPRSALRSHIALLDVLFVHTIGRYASASSSAAIFFRTASRPMPLRSFRCLRGVGPLSAVELVETTIFTVIEYSVHPKVQITFYLHFSLYFSTPRSALRGLSALLDASFKYTIGPGAPANSDRNNFPGRFASNTVQSLPECPRHFD